MKAHFVLARPIDRYTFHATPFLFAFEVEIAAVKRSDINFRLPDSRENRAEERHFRLRATRAPGKSIPAGLSVNWRHSAWRQLRARVTRDRDRWEQTKNRTVRARRQNVIATELTNREGTGERAFETRTFNSAIRTDRLRMFSPHYFEILPRDPRGNFCRRLFVTGNF